LINKTGEITFTIGNSGEANLNIIPVEDTRISLANNEAGIFSVAQQPSSTVITPGGSTAFVMRFSPTAVGAVSTAIVQIKTDSQYDDEFSFTIKGTGRNYIVGDEGPAGGIVFYDAGAVIDGWRYLEASMTSFTAPWSTYSVSVDGTGGTNIGDGKQNTQLIVAALNTLGYTGAAQLCANLDINGFNDWFLPSQGELIQLYLSRNIVGNLGTNTYWSSSQVSGGIDYTTTYAYVRSFSLDPYPANTAYKIEVRSVRAIRSF
jgi:hypothetical protein